MLVNEVLINDFYYVACISNTIMRKSRVIKSLKNYVYKMMSWDKFIEKGLEMISGFM